MPIKADYHLHSSFSGDSKALMEEMIQAGIQIGLTHMCFTEHMDLKFPYLNEPDEANFELNTDSYLYDFIRNKEKYASQIKLAFGVELGMQECAVRENAVYARSYDFDFVIASSHVCNGIDPYYPVFYENRTEKEAYREYFSSILNNIRKFNNFDVYGHLDYVIRYGPNKDKDYHPSDCMDLIDQILTHLIENEKGIEINTGGIKRGLTDVHPYTPILKRYKELGGEIITIGSDAHSPDHIADYFSKAEEVLKECGFQYYCIFENRVAEFKKL